MTNILLMLNLLPERESIKISPTGNSMRPFISGYRDDVFLIKPSFPLKRNDIALYQRESGQYVLHRIHHSKVINGETLYFFLGDSQTTLEGPIHECCIHAIATQILRKGRIIKCNNLLYRFISQVWLILQPLRPMILKLYDHFH